MMTNHDKVFKNMTPEEIKKTLLLCDTVYEEQPDDFGLKFKRDEENETYRCEWSKKMLTIWDDWKGG